MVVRMSSNMSEFEWLITDFKPTVVLSLLAGIRWQIYNWDKLESSSELSTPWVNWDPWANGHGLYVPLFLRSSWLV